MDIRNGQSGSDPTNLGVDPRAGILQMAKAARNATQSMSEFAARLGSAADVSTFMPDMRQLTAPLTFHIAEMRRAEASIASFAQLVTPAPSVFDAILQTNKIADSFSLAVTKSVASLAMPKMMAGFAGVVASVMEMAKEAREMEESDFPFKWASAAPAPLVRRLYICWKSGDLQAMYAVLTSELVDDDTARLIVQDCSTCDITSPQAQLVADALWAHQQGKYGLSVPVLMAQTEGMLRRIAVHVGAMDDVWSAGAGRGQGEAGAIINLTRRRIKTLLKAAGRGDEIAATNGMFFGPLFQPFLSFLEGEYFSKKRNPVLHGADLGYATMELSAECVLALYEALYCAYEIPKWQAKLAASGPEEKT